MCMCICCCLLERSRRLRSERGENPARSRSRWAIPGCRLQVTHRDVVTRCGGASSSPDRWIAKVVEALIQPEPMERRERDLTKGNQLTSTSTSRKQGIRPGQISLLVPVRSRIGIHGSIGPGSSGPFNPDWRHEPGPIGPLLAHHHWYRFVA